MLRILAITLLALALVVTAAGAQTATTTQTTTTTQPAPSTSTSNQGAFDKLSPGNQKIAQALYDAQQSNTQTSGSSTTSKTYSLDDIAAMKQSGKGWGVVFKDMKAQGSLPPDVKNLGQLVSGKYQPPSTSGSTTITSASGKSQTTGKSGKGHFDDSASGGTRGSSGVSSGSGKGYGHGSSSGPNASAGRGSNGGGQGVGRSK